MHERITYKNRVDAIKPALISEGPLHHGCVRAVSAGFLNVLLPETYSAGAYQQIEFAAGLRWLTLAEPAKSTPEFLEQLLTQTRLPIEGVIIYAKTKKGSENHAFSFMADAEGRRDGDQFSIDTFVSKQRWYITYPSVHDAVRFMGIVYEKPHSIRAVLDTQQPLPKADMYKYVNRLTNLCVWNMGDFSLTMYSTPAKS